jgi:hypothetical protein
MTTFRKTLHALVVLAFLTSLFALAIGEIVPNPDDFARKLLDVRQNDATLDRSLKADPNQSGAKPAWDRTSYLWEGFEGGAVPPTGWTLQQFNPVETWQIETYNPYEGMYYATCLYDATYTDEQHEWLVSPVMDFSGAGPDLKLKFAWQMSYYWGVDPYDNYDLSVGITTDGTNWDILWSEADEGAFDSWVWYEKTIPLPDYVSEPVVNYWYCEADAAGTVTGYGDDMYGTGWYFYDGTDVEWWNIWFYDHPLDLERYKEITIEFWAWKLGDPSWLELAVNWSTDQWPNGTGAPPLPGEDENLMIGRAVLVDSVDVPDGDPLHYVVTYTIPDYNPEWVSVDVRGQNFMIEGVITHECKANIQINLHYDGYDGAQGSFDAIEINDDPAPVGRCCYGDPQDPSCADNTQPECDALSGDWDDALDCTEDCPAAGQNDLCTGAVPMVDGGTYAGTTAGATVDCPGILDWNAVWFSFELTECASVTMDYCYTPSPQEVLCLGVVIYDECPEDCPNYILYTSNEWLYDCGTPTSNPRTHFDMLNAGTYYYPVFMGDAGCAPIEAPFAFDFHVVVCPQAQEGDYCDMPILVEIPADMRAEYVDFNTTCGRLDYYSNTCLGYYDGGEDIIYEVTVTEEVTVDVLVDPDATYSGFAIDDGCPLDASTCLGVATAGYSSDEYGFYGITIAPGTYYIMVDTWPSPACVDFKLTIRDPIDIGPGNTCEDPIMVKIPADLPYADLEQQTCLRNNDYASSCLGSYDNGDDAIYEIDVTEQTAVIITLDPKGTTWTGIALDDACPPASSCLAYVTGSSGSTLKVIEYTLDVGTYWIMVDTWPSPI